MMLDVGKPVLLVRHTACVTAAFIEEFAGRAGVRLESVALDAGGVLPTELDAYAAVIVLGGVMNVYQEEAHPFLIPENEWIRAVVELGKPYLGICLGGQLLAKAMGGRVTRNSVREIGPVEIALTSEGRRDPLFAGFPDRFDFCQWHQDTFSELPPGAVLLAKGADCAHQAFRLGAKAYGLQFHPEVNEALLREWSIQFRKDLTSPGQAEAVIESFKQREDTILAQSDRLFRNFLEEAVRKAH